MKSQLNGLDDVLVNTYSLESSMAEKLDAIIQRFELTSRMKDFYDIWYIAQHFDFDGEILNQAVKETLYNRGTNIDEETLVRIVNLSKNEIMLTRWNSFAKKMNLGLELSECINMIELLFGPIIGCNMDENEMSFVWKASRKIWVPR